MLESATTWETRCVTKSRRPPTSVDVVFRRIYAAACVDCDTIAAKGENGKEARENVEKKNHNATSHASRDTRECMFSLVTVNRDALAPPRASSVAATRSIPREYMHSSAPRRQALRLRRRTRVCMRARILTLARWRVLISRKGASGSRVSVRVYRRASLRAGGRVHGGI